MYDACDVLNASHCSADITNHVLREYGGGNMGRGIRKFAKEMTTVGCILGYEKGTKDAYSKIYKNIGVAVSVACVGSIIGLGAWCTKKLMSERAGKNNERISVNKKEKK